MAFFLAAARPHRDSAALRLRYLGATASNAVLGLWLCHIGFAFRGVLAKASFRQTPLYAKRRTDVRRPISIALRGGDEIRTRGTLTSTAV